MARRSVSEVWRTDRLWAPVYAYGLDRPALARAAGGLAFGTDLKRLYDALSIIAAQPDGAAILDVPCGGGVALRGLRDDQDVRYVAADISPDMLARTARAAARRGLERVVETVEADIGALPFAAGEFDLVVSFTGLHCVPEPERAVAELARVTRLGGLLALSFWASDVDGRQALMRRGARAAGLVGPSVSEAEIREWLPRFGYDAVALRRSGDFIYVNARRRA